jgi:hypothetical protein
MNSSLNRIRKKMPVLLVATVLTLGLQACGNMAQPGVYGASSVSDRITANTRAVPGGVATLMGGDAGTADALNRSLQYYHSYRMSDPYGHPRAIRATSGGKVIWRIHLEVITLLHRLDELERDLSAGRVALLRNQVKLLRGTAQGIIIHVDHLRQLPHRSSELHEATTNLMRRVHRLEKSVVLSKKMRYSVVEKDIGDVKAAVQKLRHVVASSRG